MEAIKISIANPTVRRIKALTGYKGRKVRVSVKAGPHDLRSYWDGGSRDYYWLIRMDTFDSFKMTAQSAYDPTVAGAENITLKPGMILVEWSIFCGKDLGLTIYIHPDNAPKLLT